MGALIPRSIPKQKAYQFADVVELLLSCGLYSEISRADLESLLVESLLNGEEAAGAEFITDAELNTREQGYVEDCFDHLYYRQDVFKENYPFTVKDELISLKKTKQSSWQKLYLFLLACSQLGSFENSKGVRNSCARIFTSVSAQALREMLSPKAQVWVFDANSDDRKNFFGTNFRKAFLKLGQDVLREKVHEDVLSQEDTSGDGGVDLVGVYPFSDGARSVLAVLGQCAAEQDRWMGKTLQASPPKLQNLISFSHPPANLVFIPLLFRQINGAWAKERAVSSCLLIDRLRLFTCLQSQSALPKELVKQVEQSLKRLGMVKGGSQRDY